MVKLLKENDINIERITNNMELVSLSEIALKQESLLIGYDNMARMIQDFMYEGRPRRSPKKVHTVAEHEAFLANLTKQLWNQYNKGMERVEK